MDIKEILTVLESGNQPDKNVLLDDGQYFIEHNVNYQQDRGNGFLMRRCGVSMTAPGGEECVGGYELTCDGMWRAHLQRPYDNASDSDCFELGLFENRNSAVACLWANRQAAYARAA